MTLCRVRNLRDEENQKKPGRLTGCDNYVAECVNQ